MSKLPIICILLVIIAVSVNVEGHTRGGRKNGKGKQTGTALSESSEKSPGSQKKDKQQTGSAAAKKSNSGRKGKRNKKRRCQCKVASVKTIRNCRKTGRRKTCSKVKQYFFTKKQCSYPFDDLSTAETDNSGSNDETGSNDGSDDETGPNDGTGSDDGTGSNDETGSDDGNDDGTGTGGGLDEEAGETPPGDGEDIDLVDIILIGDCTDTENPEYVLGKCATSIKEDPPLYYFETSCPTHFIQCDEHGGADIKPCAPETEWCQHKLTCDHVGSCDT
ncbi:aspartate, glycine, lysine and serine-rich protein-like isoform X3 [Mytilus californianus]|uniref:aspartate, glycine, lysine and serine-rich protein-like isoform X3 n=1 Tax=Mytilus californianus TaxID=6549 RepID=UPI002246E882|nr:aspartate, glycine, lysine and serine-rich protein-like isoform X3 [Mytilus californianus]